MRQFKPRSAPIEANMAVRFALFPAVFAGTLAFFGVGFYYRSKFVVDIDEQRERWTRSAKESRDFSAKVQEAIDHNKSDKK